MHTVNASRTTLVEAVFTTRDGHAAGWLSRAGSVLFLTGLTALAAQVSAPLPFTQVPFTLQPMVVLIGGLALGARLGGTSQILYLAAGVAGLPVFAFAPALPGGLLRLLGPTGGYLLAYPLAAYCVGALAERGFDRRYSTSLAAMTLGLLVIYACGATWLGLFARTASGGAGIGFAAALLTGVVPFLAADAVKLAAGAAIAPTLWRLVGRDGRSPR